MVRIKLFFLFLKMNFAQPVYVIVYDSSFTIFYCWAFPEVKITLQATFLHDKFD